MQEKVATAKPEIDTFGAVQLFLLLFDSYSCQKSSLYTKY